MLVFAARLTTLVAALCAAYLAWSSLATAGQVSGCGQQGWLDCSSVLASRWSLWLGLPVSLPALIVYLLALLALFEIAPSHTSTRQKAAWSLLLMIGALAAAAASWFSGLQLFALRTICPFCMAVHACGLLLAGYVFWQAPIQWRRLDRDDDDTVRLSPRAAAMCASAGLLAVCLLIGGQLLGDAPSSVMQVTEIVPSQPEIAPAVNPRPASRMISLLSGQVELDVRKLPLFGKPDAAHVIVELFDYTCPQCRRLHYMMKDARERYGDQLAVVVLPTPMNKDCNPHVQQPDEKHRFACDFARLSLTVWQQHPEVFEQYHNWLIERFDPPELDEAKERATWLIGKDRANVGSGQVGEAVDRQLAETSRIYKLAGGGAIPKLLGPTFVANGLPANFDKLCAMLEKQLGVKPIPGR